MVPTFFGVWQMQQDQRNVSFRLAWTFAALNSAMSVRKSFVLVKLADDS